MTIHGIVSTLGRNCTLSIFAISMKKVCVHCSAPFEITKEDLAFYKDMDVPAPTHCYLCRMQRRLSYRNERHLYHRKCDLTGKQIISSFSVDKPFPVYDLDAWWGDAWDPLSYGQDFDFSRPFFQQFFEMRDRVPRQALQHQKPMINSNYCNCASRNKNCYLVFSTNECEDCYYGSWVNKSKDCIDNLTIEQCELCYECVSCRDCYNLRWSRDCQNCNDSFFLRSCTGCSDCFGCSNQVNKQNMLFNAQKTPEEYQNFISTVGIGKFSMMERVKEKVDEELSDLIAKEFHGSNTENCVGDYLRNCKNAFDSFDCDDCEDIRYCMFLDESKSSMDHSHWGRNTERMYECQACGYDLFNLRFCNLCWSGCSNLVYCDQCFSSKDCFGCSGLKKAQYCILNKQYTKEEYETLVPKIIAYMKQTGEWGEFFPVEKSIYAYNETLAQEYYPLTKEEVLRNGWQWYDDQNTEESYRGPDVVLPDDIADTGDDVCTKIYRCSETGKPYKVIPQELAFHKRLNIPLPRRCPDQRHRDRFALRNPRHLWDRACVKCKKAIKTSYAPDRPEIVYCEDCYLKEVY